MRYIDIYKGLSKNYSLESPFICNSNGILENKKLFNFVNSKVKVNFVYGFSATYSLFEDEIFIPERKSFKTEEDFFHILFHELTHWSGVDMKRKMRRDTYEDECEEEIIAELGSLLLSKHFKLEYENNAFAYIQRCKEGLDKENHSYSLYSLYKEAKKAVDFIILGAKE